MRILDSPWIDGFAIYYFHFETFWTHLIPKEGNEYYLTQATIVQNWCWKWTSCWNVGFYIKVSKFSNSCFHKISPNVNLGFILSPQVFEKPATFIILFGYLMLLETVVIKGTPAEVILNSESLLTRFASLSN